CYATDEPGLPSPPDEGASGALGEGFERAARGVSGALGRAANALEAGVSSLFFDEHPPSHDTSPSEDDEDQRSSPDVEDEEIAPLEASLRELERKAGLRTK